MTTCMTAPTGGSSRTTAPALGADPDTLRTSQPEAGPARVVEVHLEELGQHSWVKALLNTLSGSYGSAQFRFVARPLGPSHDASQHVAVSSTFPVMRCADLDDTAEPNTWLDLARASLHELDRELTDRGWRHRPERGRHWWSLRYDTPD